MWRLSFAIADIVATSNRIAKAARHPRHPRCLRGVLLCCSNPDRLPKHYLRKPLATILRVIEYDLMD